MTKKLTVNKAKEILTDGSVHGKPLTLKQKRFFGAIAGGAPVKAQDGDMFSKQKAFAKKLAGDRYDIKEITGTEPYSFGKHIDSGYGVDKDVLAGYYYLSPKPGTSGGPIYTERFISKKPKQNKPELTDIRDVQTVDLNNIPYISEIVDRQMPTFTIPPITNLPYRVEYRDEKGSPTHASFIDEVASRDFWQSTPGEKTGYYEKKKSGGWLDSYQEGGVESRQAGYTDIPFNYNSAWGGQFAIGGELSKENVLCPPGYFYDTDLKQCVPSRNNSLYTSNISGSGMRREGPYFENVDMNLPQGTGAPKGFFTGFGFSQNVAPSVDVHGVGAYGEREILDGVRLTGSAVSPSVVYPGGSQLFMKPSFNVGAKMKFNAGGSLPGSVGFTYARTNSPAPSEGPYAKKTMPSAEYGMSYYQHGLDWKPRNISENGSEIPRAQTGLDWMGGDPAVQLRNRILQERLQKPRVSKQASVGPARKESFFDKQRIQNLKQKYVDAHPYAKLDDKGNITRKQWDRSIEGVADPYTPAAKIDRGLNAASTALEVAGYIEGVGAMGSALGSVGKKAVSNLKNLKQEFIYNAIDPVGYGASQKILRAPKTFLDNTILNPKDRAFKIGDQFNPSIKESLKNLDKTDPFYAKKVEEITRLGKNRLDSWRTGLGLEQKYNTFSRTPEGFYRINTMSPEPKHFAALHNDILAYNYNTNSPGFYFGENPLVSLQRKYQNVASPKIKTEYGEFNLDDIFKTEKSEVEPWKQIRKVNQKSNSNKFSVFDNDSKQGVMGGYRWDVEKLPDGNLHFQSNDRWDLHPWQERGNPNVFEDDLTKLMNNLHTRDKLKNIEALKLLGGKPFDIQNNFIVDPKTYNILRSYKEGGVIKDDMGQWAHPGEITEIGSNRITMQGVPYPVLGISDTGDTQMMLPGEEYKFKGSKVTEIPMAQNGARANRADSFAVLKNALEVANYYNKTGNYKLDPPRFGIFDIKNMDSDLKEFRESNKMGTTYPTAGGKSTIKTLPEDVYRKDVDKNRFYQRDRAYGILDTRAPMTLFDRRIEPTLKYDATNVNQNDPLYKDIISLYGYDPISVTPWNMLNPNERDIRIKRHGFSGTPYKNMKEYNNSKQKPKPQTPKPEVEKFVSKQIEPQKINVNIPQGRMRDMALKPSIMVPDMNVSSGPYMVGYHDFSGEGIDKGFGTREERDAFVQQLRGRQAGSYNPSVLGITEYYDTSKKQTKKVNQKSTGGWLDGYK